jgi:hypothetical protein
MSLALYLGYEGGMDEIAGREMENVSLNADS